MRIPKVGSVVCVEFWDHVMHGSQPILIQLYGEIMEKDDDVIVVGSWLMDDDIHDHNNNVIFTILIPVIKSIKTMRFT